MKKIVSTIMLVMLVVLAVSMPAMAQVTQTGGTLTPDKVPANGITGTLNIDFGTRQLANKDENGKVKPEAVDVYALDVFVGNTLRMAGNITYKQAQKASITKGIEAKPRMLVYQVNFTAYQAPKDPSSKKWADLPAGQLSGIVPISDANEYLYSNGTLQIDNRVLRDSPSKFSGTALGKPPAAKRASRIAKMLVAKVVKGQARKMVVTDYDIMGYPGGVTFAAGPFNAYPAVFTKGDSMYDRVRYAWFFRVKDRDLIMRYVLNGKEIEDRLGGTVLWVEAPDRESNGKGEYVFDVLLNAKDVSSDEAQAFQADEDESAFFAPQSTANSLSGKWLYVDQFEGETVVSSKVQIALVGGSEWNKARLMNFAKFFILSAIIPVNSE